MFSILKDPCILQYFAVDSILERRVDSILERRVDSILERRF